MAGAREVTLPKIASPSAKTFRRVRSRKAVLFKRARIYASSVCIGFYGHAPPPRELPAQSTPAHAVCGRGGSAFSCSSRALTSTQASGRHPICRRVSSTRWLPSNHCTSLRRRLKHSLPSPWLPSPQAAPEVVSSICLGGQVSFSFLRPQATHAEPAPRPLSNNASVLPIVQTEAIPPARCRKATHGARCPPCKRLIGDVISTAACLVSRASFAAETHA